MVKVTAAAIYTRSIRLRDVQSHEGMQKFPLQPPPQEPRYSKTHQPTWQSYRPVLQQGSRRDVEQLVWGRGQGVQRLLHCYQQQLQHLLQLYQLLLQL